MSKPLVSVADARLYLAWVRQGNIDWSDDWLRRYGPVRLRIPGLDDHISFANFDLKSNGLPPVQTTPQGRPFVMCIEPMTASELKELEQNIAGEHQRDDRLKDVVARHVVVARILDVVAYHGFEPATRTRGLDDLDRVLPRRPTRMVDYKEQSG